MPESDDQNGKSSPGQSSAKDEGLGLPNYQFFVHDVQNLEYDYHLPQGRASFSGSVAAGSGGSVKSGPAHTSAKTSNGSSTSSSNSSASGSSCSLSFAGSTSFNSASGSSSFCTSASLDSPPGEPAGATEKQITDTNGAVLTYPLWSILPSSIRYFDGNQVNFSYDTKGDICGLVGASGQSYSRKNFLEKSHPSGTTQFGAGTASNTAEFSCWQRSDGKEFIAHIRVMPDGAYQILYRNGDVHTWTTDGKRLVGKPFPKKFDIKQSLVRIYGAICVGPNNLLSKAQLDAGVTKNWKNDHDSMLIAMLKVHYELIQLLRDKALLKLGLGLSMDDVLFYDRKMRHLTNPVPTEESLKTIKAIFDLIDQDGDQNVSLSEVKENINSKAQFGRHKLNAEQKKTLNYLTTHTSKLHAFTARGYADRTARMTKNEFMDHYKDVYREQITDFTAACAWGLERAWRKTEMANRRLYANAQNPLESLKVEAIKQGSVGDCLFLAAMASVITVRPEVILSSIKQNENETFTVTFAGAKEVPVAVPAPTSAELALYARGSAYGIWAPLMEKAYGMFIANRNKKPSVIPAENTATRENMKSLEFLTGHSSHWEYTQDTCTRALGLCKRTITEN
jgi:hypothetical protein